MKMAFIAVSLFITALIASIIYFSAPSSQATHDTAVTAVISGDTNIFNAGDGGNSTVDCLPSTTTCSGNFYTFDKVENDPWDPENASTIAMRMGPIDECSVVTWTGSSGRATVDIVIENVTDFTGYQIRIVYPDSVSNITSGADINADGTGHAPFLDINADFDEQFVNFVNLPVEDQTNGHRANTPERVVTFDDPAANIDNVLLGDVYKGTRTAALSPDTTGGESAANTPDGRALLIRTRWPPTARWLAST